MIQNHILKKIRRLIPRIQNTYYGEIIYADGIMRDGDLYRTIYLDKGSGLNATQYAVICTANKRILSKHRMFIHADRKCAELSRDRDRVHYAQRRIAMLPAGGRLRDYL
jgi:hypothetical protein